MKKPVLIGILLFAAIVAAVVYFSMSMGRERVEVCMQFDGRTACRTVAGSNKEFVLRTATENACSEIASGVTETLACQRAEPVRVTWK